MKKRSEKKTTQKSKGEKKEELIGFAEVACSAFSRSFHDTCCVLASFLLDQKKKSCRVLFIFSLFFCFDCYISLSLFFSSGFP